jgi:hypothetical protein
MRCRTLPSINGFDGCAAVAILIRLAIERTTNRASKGKHRASRAHDRERARLALIQINECSVAVVSGANENHLDFGNEVLESADDKSIHQSLFPNANVTETVQ